MDINSDLETMVKIYADLGADISKGNSLFYIEHVKDYHLLCSSLMQSESMDFSQVKPIVSEMRRSLFLQSRKPELQRLSSEFTLLHKAFQALLFMLCKYKAKINTQIKI